MNKGRLMAAIFLVAGTCVGGGMLALPVTTGIAGFLPSLVAMALCAIFMAMTGLLFLEVALSMEEGVHILTMSSRMLGPIGKWLAALLYLFIGYASLVAYVSGVGDLISDSLWHRFGWQLPPLLSCGLFSLVFGAVIYFGNRIVGRVNALLFVGMIAAYLLLLLSGFGEVKVAHLRHGDPKALVGSMPLLLTIFSYQAIVPSLPLYVGRHPQALRWSIIGGSALAFLIYAIWQWLILGVVPLEGEHGLRYAWEQSHVATRSLRHFAESSWIPLMGSFFALFALITSYLGIGLGLFDFLADGLKLKRKGPQKGIITLCIVLPTLFIAVVWSRAFIVALETTGGFGDAVLNGMIPVAMVWVGRYSKKTLHEQWLFGGRPFLAILFLFALFIFGIELFDKI